MKTVRFTRRAADALVRHANRATTIRAKILAYAADPASQANNIKSLNGVDALRMRVGPFRIVFQETATDIVVLDIGPRGSIYE